MSSIFISHQSSDADRAAALGQWLKDRGHHHVFQSSHPADGIAAGRDWEHEVYRQLTTCRAVVVLCSAASMRSKWCFAEIVYARALGKPLFPVKIDDCVVHELVTDRQIVDLRDDPGCGRDQLWRGLLAAGVDPADVFDWDPSRPPYPGLLAFEEQDAAIFFGRDREITAGLAALNRVRRLASSGLLMVVGGSGTGKSSLVRAGLIPRLRQDTDRWIVVDPFRSRDDPCRELAGALSRAFDHLGETQPMDEIEAGLVDGRDAAGAVDGAPLLAVIADLRLRAGRDQAHVLLVVDQFEELLGFPRTHPATRFLAMVRQAVEAPTADLVVLATMRSDFLGEFQGNPALASVDHDTLPIGPLSRGDIAQVIERPAEMAGLELEAGLAQDLVNDGGTEGALPLLAFTLRELYDRYGGDGELTRDEYHERLGGLTGAIARVADELIESAHLPHENEDDLRRALLAMVRVSEDGRPARQAVPRAELPASVLPLLDRFVQARLLQAGGDGDDTLEVAHEALFRSWKRLAEWLDDSSADLQLRREVEQAARRYVAGGRDPADLLRGRRLGRAVDLVEQGDLSVSAPVREFVDASYRAEQAGIERQARARRRRLQIAAAFAVVTSVIAVIATLLYFQAGNERERAQDERDRATAESLAASARTLRLANPALSLALAAESAQTTPSPLPEATRALFAARGAFASRVAQPIGPPLEGHTAAVRGVAFSPDGDTVASVSDDGTVRLWSPATGQPMGEPLAPDDAGEVLAVAFSPGGELLASGGSGGAVRLWDPATGQPVDDPLTDDGVGTVRALAFSADGGLLAAASSDGSVRLWDPTTGQLATQLIGDTGEMRAVAFSPDGSLLAAGSGIDENGEKNGIVQVWDLTGAVPVGPPLTGHENHVLGVAFSPDGGTLVSASVDATLRLWDPESGEQIGELTGRIGTGRAVAFSPDGRAVAMASGDGAVRIWDAGSREALGEPLAGHVGSATALAFSPDGTMLATASEDRTVRLWELGGAEIPLDGHDDVVLSVAFSPDGELLASGSQDGTVRRWDPVTRQPVGAPLTGHDGQVLGVAFNPDGTVLASTGNDGTVRLWDRASGSPVGPPLTYETSGRERLSGLAFSPDGTTIVAASDDGRLRWWDRLTGRLVESDAAHDGTVRGVAYSPTGDLVASAGKDRTIGLWRASTGESLGWLTDHTGEVQAVAFNGDGSLLASASADGTVRLWQEESAEESRGWVQVGKPLTGHTDWVHAVAFSPDGELLVSGSSDRTVRLWDPATGQPVGEPLAAHTDPVRSVAFSADGTLLASGSNDRTVRLWDRLWDVEYACELAAPYVTLAQMEPYLPDGQTTSACDLSVTR